MGPQCECLSVEAPSWIFVPLNAHNLLDPDDSVGDFDFRISQRNLDRTRINVSIRNENPRQTRSAITSILLRNYVNIVFSNSKLNERE